MTIVQTLSYIGLLLAVAGAFWFRVKRYPFSDSALMLILGAGVFLAPGNSFGKLFLEFLNFLPVSSLFAQTFGVLSLNVAIVGSIWKLYQLDTPEDAGEEDGYGSLW